MKLIQIQENKWINIDQIKEYYFWGSDLVIHFVTMVDGKNHMIDNEYIEFFMDYLEITTIGD